MFGNSWDNILSDEIKKEYYINLMEFISSEYETKEIFPPKEKVFMALEKTPFDKVKVVILGQDLYYRKGQANGLAFSVENGNKIPPSLRNTYLELENDIGINSKNLLDKKHGDLTSWSKNGVLLLNTVLTVESGKPNSHKKRGWETFTDNVIRVLSNRKEPVVFILWGNNAKIKRKLIDEKSNLILMGNHPSPLSSYKGFFDGKYFSKANEYLTKQGIDEVDWNL